jgi:hypothetical protein
MIAAEALRTQDLAQRLAEAEEVIEALLSGQIDAVVDSKSQTPVLLSKAQEALRESEAALPRDRRGDDRWHPKGRRQRPIDFRQPTIRRDARLRTARDDRNERVRLHELRGTGGGV